MSAPGDEIERAFVLQKNAAEKGFDWERPEDVIEKIEEEVGELEKALRNETRVEEEVGDLIFAVLNFCRKAQVDFYNALRKANDKFERRWRKIATVWKDGMSLEEMERVWQKAKKEEEMKK